MFVSEPKLKLVTAYLTVTPTGTENLRTSITSKFLVRFFIPKQRVSITAASPSSCHTSNQTSTKMGKRRFICLVRTLAYTRTLNDAYAQLRFLDE